MKFYIKFQVRYNTILVAIFMMMTATIFENIDYKILVIGSIFDNLSLLSKIDDLKSNYNLIIINGNLCYPNDNLKEVEDRIDFFENKVLILNKIIYNIGHYDLILSQMIPDHKISKWILSKPNVVFLEFKNQTTIIITNGGITNNMNREKLINNIETTFISKVDNIPWHKKYNGMFGYVISNNPLTNNYPQFFAFSTQMGNHYNKLNPKVYAQEANSLGLKNTFLL